MVKIEIKFVIFRIRNEWTHGDEANKPHIEKESYVVDYIHTVQCTVFPNKHPGIYFL